MIAPMSAADGVPQAPRPRARAWSRIDPARLRFWGVLVPIHVAAFAVLYFGTFGLLERAFTQAGATAARLRLDQAVREMPFLVQSSRSNPHVFAHLLAAHQPIGLRLYRTDATPIGMGNISPDPAEISRVRAFLGRSADHEQTWIEHEGEREWMRGLVRISADAGCTPCHAAGTTLGAAAMRLDFTEQIGEIRDLLRQRVALLLGAWVALIAGVTIVVQRTVRRSAQRLHEELRAAATGDRLLTPPIGQLPLDPVSAEVHRSVRDLLARQRQREADVAVKLAHVDQLAGLGQLAAGLAHEIKNPLAGIQGALEVLRDESKDGDSTHLYEEMLAELRRVNVILHRLLESGRPAPLRLARTDLALLLGETADLLRPSLRRQRVELRTEVAADLPGVQIDPAKIRQVLVNLIQNAAEAMAEHGGHVTVRASGFPSEAAVVLAVEDDGPGIPAEQIGSVFEPFYTTKFSGTGLGLAISKTLVEQHGGRIEVSSQPGRGTTFLIILPALGALATPDAGAGAEPS
jgi:hypothetical protein